MRAELRNKDRAAEELEERHAVEVKVYKQKVKHLLYEHQSNGARARRPRRASPRGAGPRQAPPTEAGWLTPPRPGPPRPTAPPLRPPPRPHASATRTPASFPRSLRAQVGGRGLLAPAARRGVCARGGSALGQALAQARAQGARARARGRDPRAQDGARAAVPREPARTASGAAAGAYGRCRLAPHRSAASPPGRLASPLRRSTTRTSPSCGRSTSATCASSSPRRRRRRACCATSSSWCAAWRCSRSRSARTDTSTRS